jgi:hypothetical protein
MTTGAHDDKGAGWSKWEGNQTHYVGMIEALEDLHLAPHALLVPLDLLRNGLQRDIVHNIHRLGGVSVRGQMGGARGDREDRRSRGGLGGGCDGGREQTGGAALVEVPLFWWYVPCHTL